MQEGFDMESYKQGQFIVEGLMHMRGDFPVKENLSKSVKCATYRGVCVVFRGNKDYKCDIVYG